jgi:hypothetical protein
MNDLKLVIGQLLKNPGSAAMPPSAPAPCARLSGLLLMVGLVACCLFCLSSGCVSMSTNESVQRAPTTQIDLFRDGLIPPRPHKEIGALESSGGLEEQASIEKKFIGKAKAIGGNALILHRSPLATGGYRFRAAIVVYK